MISRRAFLGGVRQTLSEEGHKFEMHHWLGGGSDRDNINTQMIFYVFAQTVEIIVQSTKDENMSLRVSK